MHLDQRSDFVGKSGVSHPPGLSITGNLVGSDCWAIHSWFISSSSLGQLGISSYGPFSGFQMLLPFYIFLK